MNCNYFKIVKVLHRYNMFVICRLWKCFDQICFWFMLTNSDKHQGTKICIGETNSNDGNNTADPSNHGQIVIKSFTFDKNKKTAKQSKHLKSFEKQYQTMKQLNQSNYICNALSFINNDTSSSSNSIITYRITMEKMQIDYFDYQTKCIENGMIASLKSVQLLAMNMFNGLNDMHKKGIGHFDIKPENLFLNCHSKNEYQIIQCKIGDFGNSKKFYDLNKKKKVIVQSRKFKSLTPEYCGMCIYM